MKKFLVIIIIFLSLATITYLLVNSSSEISTPHSEIRNPKYQYVAAEGKVEAMPGFEVAVGSELTGKIERFYVREGDRVKKGAIIATLANKDIESKLREAEGELIVARSRLREVASGSRMEEIGRARAAYDAAVSDMELAKKTLERYEGLYKEGVISKALLEEKENAYKVALARAREAEEEKRLVEKGPKDETIRLLEDTVKRTEATVEYYRSLMEKTVIRAPISGKIIHKYLEEGEIVNTMSEVSPLVDIADVERIRINAEVDETDAGKIGVGDPAEITSDTYPGKLFHGEIEEIAGYVGKRAIRPNNPAKNLDMKVIQVKIKLKEKTPLKLGMTVDVRIVPGK